MLSRTRLTGAAAFALAVVLTAGAAPQTSKAADVRYIQFVFTADQHYGLTRDAFRGASHVDAHVVNAALVAKINALGATRFPADGGLRAGDAIGALDFIAQGGDIANREEETANGLVQNAAVSWAQFLSDFVDGVTAKTPAGGQTPVYMVPGNHDLSNAVGYYKPMKPATDRSSIVGIFNRMMAPNVPRTVATFDAQRDVVMCSRDLAGVHFVFITLWPDSRTRTWLERDLSSVSPSTPVVFFTHDPPESDPKHFINPNGSHDINATDQFEDLLSDTLADGSAVGAGTLIEQRAFESFLSHHQNISAYFHGHSNWNQFYEWNGPGHTITLHAFRVDSPMKGKTSATDETQLSFHVATIDTAKSTMTVRECLWNAGPDPAAPAVSWRTAATVNLRPPEPRTWHR
jgi:hypothetical protein